MLRIIRSVAKILAFLCLAFVVWVGFYAYNEGFTKKWRRLIMQEFDRRGMADADYGYVGSGKDVISLYKGKDLVKRNISSKDAVDELINLIKANNDWVEPLI